MEPRTNDKHVGIEFEVISNQSFDSARTIFSLEFPELHSFVRIGTDNSINPRLDRPENEDEEMDEGSDEDDVIEDLEQSVVPSREYGLEIRFISKQDELKDNLTKVQRLINRLSCRVNSSCGLHVHLDMRQRRPTKCYKNLIRTQDILMQLVDSTRRNNVEYCEKVNVDPALLKKLYFSDTGKPDYNGMYIGRGNQSSNPTYDRYTAINAQAYYKFRTIEVRLHHGSIDMTEIYNWCLLLTTIVDARTIANPITNLEQLKSSCRAMKTQTVKYINRTIEKYAS